MSEHDGGNSFAGWDVIHTYSRAEALRDGQLRDATAQARQAGIVLPVALTAAAWGAYVSVPAGVSGQDEAGRLWDVLYMLACTIRAAKQLGRGGESQLLFSLCVRNSDAEAEPAEVTLKAVVGPGDNAEPVLTVMLPDED